MVHMFPSKSSLIIWSLIKRLPYVHAARNKCDCGMHEMENNFKYRNIVNAAHPPKCFLHWLRIWCVHRIIAQNAVNFGHTLRISSHHVTTWTITFFRVRRSDWFSIFAQISFDLFLRGRKNVNMTDKKKLILITRFPVIKYIQYIEYYLIYFSHILTHIQMWIYSLGITLRRTLQSFSTANIQRKATQALNRGSGGATMLNAQNDIGNTNQRTMAPGALTVRCESTAASHHSTGNNENDESDINNRAQIAPKNSSKKSSLDYVIRTMCAPNRNNRASLMYLLDVSIIITSSLPFFSIFCFFFSIFYFVEFPLFK